MCLSSISPSLPLVRGASEYEAQGALRRPFGDLSQGAAQFAQSPDLPGGELTRFELEEELEAQISPTRLFSCSAPERARVAAVVGRPGVTVAQLGNIVSGAIAQARADAGRAIRLLRARPRSARTTAAFRGVFNVPPTFVPAWRTPNSRWRDLGELVALRLERASAILGGGHLRLFCVGAPRALLRVPGPLDRLHRV